MHIVAACKYFDEGTLRQAVLVLHPQNSGTETLGFQFNTHTHTDMLGVVVIILTCHSVVLPQPVNDAIIDQVECKVQSVYPHHAWYIKPTARETLP